MTDVSEPYDLSTDNKLIHIALPYPTDMPKMSGYEGESRYLALWESKETEDLCWFDGKAGCAALFDATWQDWRQQDDVRFAFRGLELISDFSERGYALIFADSEQRLYFGKLTHIRKVMATLSEIQHLIGPMEMLLSEHELSHANNNGLTEEQVLRLASVVSGGSKRSVIH